MADTRTGKRFRFGVFEADADTGELRRQGLRVRLHAQPFQLLLLLLDRPGEVLTREEISRELWPDGTFVDFEHGVNSAVNRIREVLGDKASQPRYIETLAKRGYRFLAPVERSPDASQTLTEAVPAPSPNATPAAPSFGLLDRILASPEDLPAAPHRLVRTLFLLLQAMYLGFYVGALANLPEISDLLTALPSGPAAFTLIRASAAALIPVRVFLFCAVLFRAPGFDRRFRRLWPFLLAVDLLWALSPFLLLHHINYGVALACTAVLVYAPFAQRSLMLMGAASRHGTTAA